MNSNKIRVSVNGYGVIGKRVADAVRLQPDMQLAGVADVVSDYRVQTGTVTNGRLSIRMTDEALGLRRDFLSR